MSKPATTISADKHRLLLKDATDDTMEMVLPEENDGSTVLVTLRSAGFGAEAGSMLTFYLEETEAAELATFLFGWVTERSRKKMPKTRARKVRS